MGDTSAALSSADWPIFTERGLDLAALGGAYLVALLNVLLAVAAFAAARRFLVVSPNRGAKDYARYASAVLVVLLAAMVLENELLPIGSAVLHYAEAPHLLALLAVHVALYRKVEPLRVTLAGAATAGALATLVLVEIVTGLAAPAHWLGALALALLLGLLAHRSISTKRAYMKASSIYVDSKEASSASAAQVPWLGVRHWIALGFATIALSTLNSTLQGVALEQVPALDVALDALLMVGVTVLVCAIPAGAYWFVRRAWMPELTHFVWLVWLIVGFTFTYGNYLTRLDGL